MQNGIVVDMEPRINNGLTVSRGYKEGYFRSSNRFAYYELTAKTEGRIYQCGISKNLSIPDRMEHLMRKRKEIAIREGLNMQGLWWKQITKNEFCGSEKAKGRSEKNNNKNTGNKYD